MAKLAFRDLQGRQDQQARKGTVLQGRQDRSVKGDQLVSKEILGQEGVRDRVDLMERPQLRGRLDQRVNPV